MRPRSRRPSRSSVKNDGASALPMTSTPIRFICDFWARATMGQATAPPKVPRNSRRLIAYPKLERRLHLIASGEYFNRGWTRHQKPLPQCTVNVAYQIPIAQCAAFSAPHPPRVLSLAAFARRPLLYVAPMSLAGIRNPQHNRTHAPQQTDLYSITSSALASSSGGMVNPRVLAVLRLTSMLNLVGCWTGRSPGLSPLKMRSTYEAVRRNNSISSGP